MSYDISLKDPVTRKTIVLDYPHFMTGGTFAIGGTNELWLNITYNYSSYYYEVTDGDDRFAHDEVSAYYADGTCGPVKTEYGIRGIYGKTGAQSIPMLRDMILRIENKYKVNGEWVENEGPKEYYWDDTAGNAIKPLYQLIAMAQMRPDGIWDGD